MRLVGGSCLLFLDINYVFFASHDELKLLLKLFPSVVRNLISFELEETEYYVLVSEVFKLKKGLVAITSGLCWPERKRIG
jgi:hypothetical protein